MQTVSEVDQILSRLRGMSAKTMTLSRQDVDWLLAEIDGGREAFDAVVQQKKGLEQQSLQMRRTIDDLLAMRGSSNAASAKQ